jgi:hypothetical protein
MYLTIGSQLKINLDAIERRNYHLSLLIWSPYPGVSTMLRRRRTPFSSITSKRDQRLRKLEDWGAVLWETAWISVVCRTGSLTVSLPLLSMRCAAKMVLINVDFPRPVCPARRIVRHGVQTGEGEDTYADDVELEASLEQLPFDLAGN